MNTNQMMVRDFDTAMNKIAPTSLAQDWDNVGLLTGHYDDPMRSVMLCIDLTPAVAKEAVSAKVDLVMAYHPPIFKPLKRLIGSESQDAFPVYHCVRNGVAIYSTHTALDAAVGGTNDVIADLCSMTNVTHLEYVETPGQPQAKLIVFVPEQNVDDVADAMFDAGAGQIGDYQQCSFRSNGTGTFFGNEDTNPAVGRKGKRESVAEIRLEVVVPQSKISEVLRALRESHPYEEPAYDLYTLQPRPTGGIGRIGSLPSGTTLNDLATTLKKATNAPLVQIVGPADTQLKRGIIVVGSAGRLPFQAGIGKGDVVITGEIRHHDALAFRTAGATAIALNHWSSERPALRALADLLRPELAGVHIALSEADQEIFAPIP
ncbi:MAG: Nif3-like dinuclear metal center hexameric protein [Phycisphaerae bacterium]